MKKFHRIVICSNYTHSSKTYFARYAKNKKEEEKKENNPNSNIGIHGMNIKNKNCASGDLFD